MLSPSFFVSRFLNRFAFGIKHNQMNKKIKIAFIASLFCLPTLIAQTAADALRFTQTHIGGTARTVGIGGGIGALGADYGVMLSNPAGLATFRRSEFTITPAFHLSNIGSTLEGEGNELERALETNINTNNLGYVNATQPSDRWRTMNFSMGFNKIANFDRVLAYDGTSLGSYTDRFVELADGLTLDELGDFDAWPAYSAGAIYNPDANNPTFYQSDFFLEDMVDKEQVVTTTGKINEWTMGLAGSYKDKLMIGGSIGIPFLRYVEDKVYKETDREDRIPIFNELQFNENLTTNGVGINAKFGIIYRASQAVRVGAAIHSPSFYALTDTYSTGVIYEFQEGANGIRSDEKTQDSPGTFNYNFRTPFKVVGSAAFIIGRSGFVHGEVEYLDYGKSSYNFDNPSVADIEYQTFLNGDIRNQYQSALNIRVGGEYAKDIFRIRAGFNINGTPYAVNTDELDLGLAVGFGVRKENFFLDLGLRQFQTNLNYVPYVVASDFYNQQSVTSKITSQELLYIWSRR